MNRVSVVVRGLTAALSIAGAVAFYLTGGEFWIIATLLLVAAALIYSIMGRNYWVPDDESRPSVRDELERRV